MKMNARLLSYAKPTRSKDIDQKHKIAELKAELETLSRLQWTLEHAQRWPTVLQELCGLLDRYQPAHTCVDFPNRECPVCGS